MFPLLIALCALPKQDPATRDLNPTSMGVEKASSERNFFVCQQTLHGDTRRPFALCFYYDNKTTPAIQKDHVSTKTDRNLQDSPLVVLLYESLPTSAEDFLLSLVFDILLRAKCIKSKSTKLRQTFDTGLMVQIAEKPVAGDRCFFLSTKYGASDHETPALQHLSDTTPFVCSAQIVRAWLGARNTFASQCAV